MRFAKVLSGLIVLLFVLSIASAQTLKIVHFDIGQGDATLIISPTGETMLVDAGYQNEVYPLQNWLQSNGITDLNYTVATHYHADHIGGFLTLFPAYLPDIAYDRGDNPGYTTATYYNYISAASSVRQTLNAGDQIDLGGGVNVTAVCVNGHLMNGANYTLNDENERSICLLVEYNNFRYVVAGDLGGGTGGLYDLETPCSQLIGDIDVFEVDHHGSYSSTNANWLATLDAEAAVVSLADNNSYGFVHPDVIARVDADPSLQGFYHTEEGFNLSTKSIVVNDHVILETDGWIYYDIAGDNYPLGPAITVDVTIDPLTILPIPATGGTLYWDLTITNQETLTLPVAIRFYLDVPNYGEYNLIYLQNFDLAPLPTGATRAREIYLPAGAPGGDYELVGEIRDEDEIVLYAYDSEAFQKTDAADNLDLSFLSVIDDEALNLIPAAELPFTATMLSAYPQPFNPDVNIAFSLSDVQEIELAVYDLQGRKLETLLQRQMDSGNHLCEWHAGNRPAGVYFARLTGEGFIQTTKLLYLK